MGLPGANKSYANDLLQKISGVPCSFLSGIGYHLTIVRSNKSKSKRITKLIKSYVPQAHLEAKVGSELAYILPREMSSEFEDLFNAIERNRLSLGVDSYGASVTTMEEVFIRYVINR